jgi:hypothetical protein
MEEQKPAYVGFAAGLMLQTLIEKMPVRVITKPVEIDHANPAHYWPEGYLYVIYCLHVRSLVIEIDYHGQQGPDDALGDMRSWWSFKENVGEDPALAISFLDLFAGDTPDWVMPGFFQPERSRVLLSQQLPFELARPEG